VALAKEHAGQRLHLDLGQRLQLVLGEAPHLILREPDVFDDLAGEAVDAGCYLVLSEPEGLRRPAVEAF
jgi:hypothetical protein